MNKKAEAKEGKQKKEKSDYWRHPTYGQIFGPKLVTPMGRIGWAHLIKPKEFKGKIKEGETPPTPRYELTFMLKKDDAKVKVWLEQLEVHKNEMVKLFNDGAKTKIMVESTAQDGDKDFDFDEYPSLELYKGNWIMTFRNAEKPNLYGLDKDEKGNLIPVEDRKFLAGILARAVITPIITASGGITYKMLDVQYLRDDGIRYGGNAMSGEDLLSKTDDLFDDLPDLTAEAKDAPKNESLAKAAANVL